MYHSVLRDVQKVLNEAQIASYAERGTQIVFGETPPVIGWRKARTLKDYLERAKITNRDTKESKSARCNSKRCQVRQCIEKASEFVIGDWSKYNIRKGVTNCNTDFTVYKFHCSSCSKQYVGSNITDFSFLLSI